MSRIFSSGIGPYVQVRQLIVVRSCAVLGAFSNRFCLVNTTVALALLTSFAYFYAGLSKKRFRVFQKIY
jgi:F0F1-type ATP synthase membrane subunit a